jgi:hypothetical protein
VKTHSADLRILAVVPPDRHTEIALQLVPFKAELLFARRSARKPQSPSAKTRSFRLLFFRRASAIQIGGNSGVCWRF